MSDDNEWWAVWPIELRPAQCGASNALYVAGTPGYLGFKDATQWAKAKHSASSVVVDVLCKGRMDR